MIKKSKDKSDKEESKLLRSPFFKIIDVLIEIVPVYTIVSFTTNPELQIVKYSTLGSVR